MNEIQFSYLMALFYKRTLHDSLFKHYCDILNKHNIFENAEAYVALCDMGYIMDKESMNCIISDKGMKYIWTHMPFNELWQLYRDEALQRNLLATIKISESLLSIAENKI